MKLLLSIAFALVALSSVSAQNEQAPILEKPVSYKNWTYKDVRTGEPRELRQLIKDKKLAIVVYYAPWCGNWRHDAPMLQRLYDKYKDAGLTIIGVAEYDPVASMKNNLEFMKIAFPAVYESEVRSAKMATSHYELRRWTGDTRNWGSPWYIFLDPKKIEKKGDVLTTKTDIINGELRELEGEQYIRRRLGLAPEKFGVTDALRKTTAAAPSVN